MTCFNISIGGYNSVVRHSTSKKHQTKFKAMQNNNTTLYIVALNSKLAGKISCGRTKCKAIAQNVLSPRSLLHLYQKLINHNPPLFYSTQTDTSNKKKYQIVPEDQQNYVIDFIENSDETADGIFKMINNIFTNSELDWEQVSGFCGDNCVIVMRIYFTTVLKKKAMDYLDIDVENLILTINFKRFYNFVEIEWKELIRHVGTRWLSLLPCVDRILCNYQTLISYFLSHGSDCPKQIQSLLKTTEDSHVVSEEIEIYLLFCNNILHIFNNAVKKILLLINYVDSQKYDCTINKRLETYENYSRKMKDIDLPNMILFIQFLLTVPSSSAFTERVFSVMNTKCSDERN
ncbi:Uncharacterized protein FWK35_00023555, partial [Aphis craccivora]